ncbi:MAG: Rid family detoxifying hydrolase [Bacteroidetes bacterium]|nr:Rid family detoxifying hydrolase [Bacteroidota bacterium]
MLCFLSGCDTPGDRADQIAPEHEKTIVKTADVIGPYSPGVKVGRLLFVSGQIALDPETGEMRDESIEAEARQVIANLSGVLDAAGYDASHVVRATVYLTDIGNYQRVNAVYADFFPEGGYPARVAVEVAKLPKNANVEISAIAYK